MKKIAIVILALMVLAIPITAFAENKDVADSVYVFAADEQFNGNLIKGAFKVEINGRVNGDLFVGGNEVVINGEITGSVFAAAMSITIGEKAKIMGNTYLGASLVSIDGTTEGNVYSFSSSFDLGKTAQASQDVYAFAGALIIEGKVGRDFHSSAGTADIMGEVGRDVQFFDVGQLKITDSAAIGGQLTYRSANEANISSGAKVDKETIQKQAPIKPSKEEQRKQSAAVWLINAVYKFFAILIVALFMALLMPNKSRVIANSISSNFWMNLLTGLVTLLVVPLASLLLIFTIIGIPAALLALIVYGIIIYVSPIFVGIIAGVYLINKMAPKMNPKSSFVLATMLGTAIIYIIIMIPILGGVISFLTALLAFGAIWHEKGRIDNVPLAPAAKK